MDYEKAYKEAKKRGKEALLRCRQLSTEANMAVAYALDYVFGETKESEDERVRTRLIALVEAFGQGKYKNEMLAYLEKSEIRIKIPKFRVGDIIQRVQLEPWDKSRKIISINEYGYNFDLSHLGDTVSCGTIGFAFEDEFELVEQKPADSEEKFESIDNAFRKGREVGFREGVESAKPRRVE